MSKGSKKMQTSTKEVTAASATTSRKRPRRDVQVVACAFAFPISTKEPLPARVEKVRAPRTKLLDFRDVAQEIRHFGATGFAGKAKRSYQDEQFKLLTGREKKKHSVPLPIVRGIRKKAVAREARAAQEAKEAGLVLPKKKKQNNKKDEHSKTKRAHGPAPTVGFMKKGILNVKDRLKDKGRR
jgi:hypothetical protein